MSLTWTRSSILLGVATASMAAAAVAYYVSERKRSSTTRPPTQDSGPSPRREKPSLPSNLERELHKEHRRQQMIPKLTMKKPMYDNILMKDSQGRTLCTISRKKACWYVEKKDLAEWISEDTIQLKFAPQHVSTDNLVYNISRKTNQCVVCGVSKEYMRHYIVPYCYRSRFPEHFKTHLPHDVVLMCPICHVTAEKASHERMNIMERKLRRSLPKITGQPVLIDRQLHHIQSAAAALLKWKERLPIDRIKEYENALREHLQVDVPTTTLLERASQIEFQRENPEFISGADLVIATLKCSDDLIAEFVCGWRKHFVQTMHPAYLPEGWHVDSAVRSDSRI